MWDWEKPIFKHRSILILSLHRKEDPQLKEPSLPLSWGLLSSDVGSVGDVFEISITFIVSPIPEPEACIWVSKHKSGNVVVVNELAHDV